MRNEFAELIIACEDGNLQQVKYLVDSGADIHTWDDYPLRWVSKYGHLEIVKYLVDSGADIHTCDDAPLRLASKYNYLDVVVYLRQVANKKWKCNDCIVKVTCLNLCEGWNKK